MRVVVTGAAGLLGRAVELEYAGRQAAVTALGRTELDVTNIEQVRGIIGAVKPEIVVNCAGYTNVDGAEVEARRAFLVNGLGPRNLAIACRENGAALVHVSTDYIFDGDKEDPYTVWDTPRPLNVYGKSKLWGEKALRIICDSYYLVRTSWLFGPGGNNFVTTMLRLGRREGKNKVVNDQKGSPTYTKDLARAIADLTESGCYGVYHVTNQGSTSWYDFAREIYKKCGFLVNLTPCTTQDFDRPARRPRYSVLDPFPLRETTGYLLPPWEDALTRYLADYKFSSNYMS